MGGAVTTTDAGGGGTAWSTFDVTPGDPQTGTTPTVASGPEVSVESGGIGGTTISQQDALVAFTALNTVCFVALLYLELEGS